MRVMLTADMRSSGIDLLRAWERPLLELYLHTSRRARTLGTISTTLFSREGCPRGTEPICAVAAVAIWSTPVAWQDRSCLNFYQHEPDAFNQLMCTEALKRCEALCAEEDRTPDLRIANTNKSTFLEIDRL
jgi:hypothetical protein